MPTRGRAHDREGVFVRAVWGLRQEPRANRADGMLVVKGKRDRAEGEEDAQLTASLQGPSSFSDNLRRQCEGGTS